VQTQGNRIHSTTDAPASAKLPGIGRWWDGGGFLAQGPVRTLTDLVGGRRLVVDLTFPPGYPGCGDRRAWRADNADGHHPGWLQRKD